MTRNLLPIAFALCFLIAAAIYVMRADDSTILEHPRVVETSEVIGRPFVMFRTLAPKELHGRVSMVVAATPGGTRYVAALSCARVHYAGGAGLCLVEEAVGTTVAHAAYVFDRTFSRGRRIDLTGVPTRARIAPNGTIAAITIYGEEHAPNGDERLATHSVIIDMASGRVIADLRDFSIDWSGKPAPGGPLDFASVAFDRDGDRFFATLLTSTDQYVIAGSIADRQATVIAKGMASEALSPDGKKLIVKKRGGGRTNWLLSVFDLATRTERAVNQGPQSVDDQVEWLDDRHLIYHDATEQGTGVWALATDGVTGPKLLLSDAYSPSAQQ